MPPSEPGRLALGHIDRALDGKPRKDGRELSAALRCLAEYRDRITAAYRERPDGNGRELLHHVNGVISSVMSVQFPVGDVQWDELDAARRWLAEALDS